MWGLRCLNFTKRIPHIHCGATHVSVLGSSARFGWSRACAKYPWRVIFGIVYAYMCIHKGSCKRARPTKNHTSKIKKKLSPKLMWCISFCFGYRKNPCGANRFCLPNAKTLAVQIVFVYLTRKRLRCKSLFSIVFSIYLSQTPQPNWNPKKKP